MRNAPGKRMFSGALFSFNCILIQDIKQKCDNTDKNLIDSKGPMVYTYNK